MSFEERPDSSDRSLVPELDRHPDELCYEGILFFRPPGVSSQMLSGGCQTATNRKQRRPSDRAFEA